MGFAVDNEHWQAAIIERTIEGVVDDLDVPELPASGALQAIDDCLAPGMPESLPPDVRAELPLELRSLDLPLNAVIFLLTPSDRFYSTSVIRPAVRRVRQASELFGQNVLQVVFVETEVRNQLLQLTVFMLKLLQTPQLSDAQTAVYLLPTIVRLLRNPHS